MTKGQRTRERLLRAAIDRFGAEGFRATAVSQLSRDAGLTPAAAYAYFDDKEAFWEAAITADLDALDAEIRLAALTSERPLYDLMSGLVGGLRRHPLIRRVLEDGTPADLTFVLGHRFFAETTAIIRDRLQVRVDSGVLPSGSDAAMLALGIETVLFALVLSIVRAGMEEDSDRIWAVVNLLRAAAGGPPMPGEILERPVMPATPARPIGT
jgi:AcrR family transcriptional regulator